MTISTRAPLFSLCLAACGTQYIGGVDGENLNTPIEGSSSSTTDDAPGQTATSAPASDGAGGTETGAAPLCEADPDAVCGPAPVDVVGFGVPSSPEAGPQTPATYDYDCTITELEWLGAGSVVMTGDCGTEFPVFLDTGLPEATYAKLSLGQQVHATFTISHDGNGQALRITDTEGALVFLMYSGTDLDPVPGETPFAPFAVTAEEDLCLAPCPTDDACYAWDRQRLDFVAEDASAQIWQTDEATMTVAGTDYLVTVVGAQGVDEVAPESPKCGIPYYAYYSFRIADISP